MNAKNAKKVKVEPLILESYLSLARASAGSKMFRRYYAKVNGQKMEVLRDGRLSCAFHISAILKTFSLIGEVQITIHRLIDELLRSGWRPVKKSRPGAVIIWKEKLASQKRMKKDAAVYSSKVKHAGIDVGQGRAVHNDGDAKRTPVLSKITYRPVEIIFWNKKLDA